jgi:hypothetical protein
MEIERCDWPRSKCESKDLFFLRRKPTSDRARGALIAVTRASTPLERTIKMSMSIASTATFAVNKVAATSKCVSPLDASRVSGESRSLFSLAREVKWVNVALGHPRANDPAGRVHDR